MVETEVRRHESGNFKGASYSPKQKSSHMKNSQSQAKSIGKLN